jgi:hypothetical protein
MVRSSLLLLLVTLVAVSPVQRASAGLPQASHATRARVEPGVNCSKARTPYEKLVCATPDLSAADRAMAAAYGVALKTHPFPGSVRAMQVRWNASCPVGQSVPFYLKRLQDRTRQLTRMPVAVFTEASNSALFAYHEGAPVFEMYEDTVNGRKQVTMLAFMSDTQPVANPEDDYHGSCSFTGSLDPKTGKIVFDVRGVVEGSPEKLDPPAAAGLNAAGDLVLVDSMPCFWRNTVPAGVYPRSAK